MTFLPSVIKLKKHEKLRSLGQIKSACQGDKTLALIRTRRDIKHFPEINVNTLLKGFSDCQYKLNKRILIKQMKRIFQSP